VRLNIDGAFYEASKTGGWGFVIRDHDGNGVPAGAGKIEFVHDAQSVEAEACLYALLTATSHGISHIANSP
jgi:ribonuclease HI